MIAGGNFVVFSWKPVNTFQVYCSKGSGVIVHTINHHNCSRV